MNHNQALIITDPSVEKTLTDGLSAARVGRYTAAAATDRVSPVSTYMWNCRISSEFYLPLHLAEIATRNTIHKSLLFRDKDWPSNPTLRGIMGGKFKSELDAAVAEEKAQHGTSMTCDHIVSALTFGFWEHLTTKRFERFLFPKGISITFKGAPMGKRIHDLHDLIESVRRWRNRIAHHNPIFDKNPSSKYHDALTLIEWCSPAMNKWVASANSVQAIINDRPKAPEEEE